MGVPCVVAVWCCAMQCDVVQRVCHVMWHSVVLCNAVPCAVVLWGAVSCTVVVSCGAVGAPCAVARCGAVRCSAMYCGAVWHSGSLTDLVQWAAWAGT